MFRLSFRQPAAEDDWHRGQPIRGQQADFRRCDWRGRPVQIRGHDGCSGRYHGDGPVALLRPHGLLQHPEEI